MRVFLLSLLFASTYAKNIFTPPKLYGEERTLDCEYFTTNSFYETERFYACKVKTGFANTIAKVTNASRHGVGKTNEDVQKLIFEDVELALLPSGLAKIFPNLIGLKISNTGLRHLRKTDLASFTKLKYISVTKTEIRVLEKDLFKANTELIFVDLSNNLISYIHENAFDVTALQIEKLLIEPIRCDLDAKNALTLVDTIMLIQSLQESCSNIIALENAYSSVVNDFVEKLEEFSGKSITTENPIPTATKTTSTPFSTSTESQCDTSKKISKLKKNIKNLETSFNNCQDVKKLLEKRNKDLKEELDEARNPVSGTCRFKNIFGVYACVANELTINSTSDQKVAWTGTHLYPKTSQDIKILLIRDQSTQLLPLEVGKSFKKLETFIVESSGLQKLAKNDFKTLENLKKLILTGNEISLIKSGTFDILTKLSILDLSKNEISTLPLKAFDKLVQLTYLDLNENELTHLEKDLIPDNNNIDEFYARKNNLITIDVSLILRIKTASIIDFSGNTCNMKFDKNDGLSFENDFFNEIVNKCN